MTAGELAAQLATVDPELELLVAVGGDFVPLSGLAWATGSPYGVIHRHGKRINASRLSIIVRRSCNVPRWVESGAGGL